MQQIKVLLVDDDEDDYLLTRDLIRDVKTTKLLLEWEPDYGKALEKIIADEHDVYLIDYRLGRQSGLDLIETSIGNGNRVPFIMMTGQDDYGVDMVALKTGATDYLVKSKLDSYNLERAIIYAMERNKVNEEIYEREQRLRTISHNSSDAIFLTDADEKIVEVNPAAERLFNMSQSHLLEMHMKDLFASEDDYTRLKKTLEVGTVFPASEVVFKDKFSKPITCLLTPQILSSSTGKFKGIHGIIHDITELKKAERQLVFAEKLSMTGRIARSIAHEVRNPLTNVVLSLEQLRSELPSENEDLQFYLDIISSNSKRINQLLTELLDSAKPTELNRQNNSINSAIDDTLRLADDRIKLLDIELVKKYNPNIPDFQFDKEKLKIAFLNIIINSIEAMTGETRKLTITTDVKKNTCVVIIEDTGVGISKENVPQLFDAFFTQKKNGTGLGLTTTQNIIATHRGHIEYESEVGKGTRCTIIFNLNEN